MGYYRKGWGAAGGGVGLNRWIKGKHDQLMTFSGKHMYNMGFVKLCNFFQNKIILTSIEGHILQAIEYTSERAIVVSADKILQ